MTTESIEQAAAAAAQCGHHWVIESPNGPTSTGTCRRCGEIREFKNSIQITSWESESSHLHRSQNNR